MVWKEWFNQHKGKSIGLAFGVFFGFIYLICGFWDMLIFAFIVYVGYYIGQRLDQRDTFRGWDHFWQWLTERWRMFR